MTGWLGTSAIEQPTKKSIKLLWHSIQRREKILTLNMCMVVLWQSWDVLREASQDIMSAHRQHPSQKKIQGEVRCGFCREC